jgi:hypothetical protein
MKIRNIKEGKVERALILGNINIRGFIRELIIEKL